jgi:hypothetical protein
MAGIGGFQTTVKGAVSFTGDVVEVTNISFPELSVTDIDVSSFDSEDNFMEFVGGSVDPGVIDLELNYDKTQDVAMLASLGLANEDFTVTFPDGSTWVTDGYVNKIGGGTSAPNDKISRVMSIKCSGVPAFTPAA